MANYRVVDTDQLEADLTVVADAIREKSGTSEPLEFPLGMKLAIETLLDKNDDTGEPIAVNNSTDIVYQNLPKALNEAMSGETIKLLNDAEVSQVTIPANVIFDLNGHTLESIHVACIGDIVDLSAENTGLLVVEKEKIVIQKNNSQLPVRDTNGYMFCEVTKFNEAFQSNRHMFQPFIEASAHNLLKLGSDQSQVSICSLLVWGANSQEIKMLDSLTNAFLNSYNTSTGKYASMYTHGLNNVPNAVITVRVVVKSDLGVEFVSNGVVIDNTNAATVLDYQNALAEMGVHLNE